MHIHPREQVGAAAGAHEQLVSKLAALNPHDAEYATQFVDRLLTAGRERGASDLHLQPAPSGLELRWRIDGVLTTLGTFPPGVAANVIARLKVLADLLTYRNEVPQEGRIRTEQSGFEVRVSTFPTLYGERAVIRYFDNQFRFGALSELGFPDEVLDRLRRTLSESSGAILVCGPAGSGKTTTLYACLNEISAQPHAARSIVTLEDPIEMALSGVSQSQINVGAGFDWATGLRSVLRQDPQVIMIGEIRDRPSARAALEAALTGQLVLSSFHAGSAAEAIGRLLDMDIEPYVLRSGILAVVFQRLARKLCDCARPSQGTDELLGLHVSRARVPVGCPDCAHSGYRGRMVLAEMLLIDSPELSSAILSKADASALEQLAVQAGMVDRWTRAARAVAQGITSPAEIRRVLGFSRNPAA